MKVWCLKYKFPQTVENVSENQERITHKKVRVLETAVSDNRSDNGIMKGKLVKAMMEYHSVAEANDQETTSDGFVKLKRRKMEPKANEEPRTKVKT